MTTKNSPEANAPGANETSKARVSALVREEFSRKAFSYFLTALFALFFGLVAAPGLATAVSGGEEFGGWATDLLFLAIVSILSVNVFSKNYFMLHRDPFSGWLVFLRGLPVSPREMVFARSLIMLPATLVMTGIFFAPLAALSGFLDLRLGAAQFLWFVLLWLGYALAAGGMNLLIELGARGGIALFFQFLWLVVMLAVVWAFGGEIVTTTFTLAGSYGPLAGGAALFVGGVAFAILARTTERRVASREFAV